MDLIDGISDLENFGIDLKLPNSESEEFYCEALRRWFSTERGYTCYATTNKEFVVGSKEIDVATIYIYDSVLRMKPIIDDPYEILMCILEFIAENHKKVVMAYEYLMDNEDVWFSDERRSTLKKEKKIKEEIEDESTEDDSDDEWI